MPWVCLRIRKNVVTKGVMTHYKPGEWVNVGRQTAENWIASGEAYTLDAETATGRPFEPTAGVLFRGTVDSAWRQKVAEISGLQTAFDIEQDSLTLPFTETLILTPRFDLRIDYLTVGFNLLKRWQVAVPLWDYETLAANVGSDEDRAKTEAVIRDLRVPLRDTRLIFVRRCNDTRRLIELWQSEMAGKGDERLAFMRALYTVKPVVCDLPAEWTGKR